MEMIKVDNVSKEYDAQGEEATLALRDVRLHVNDGEFVCLVGPSGCGKSTLLSIVAGLLGYSSGAISVAGTPVTGTSRDIGVVFQDASLFPWKTIKKNIAYGLNIAKVPKDEQEIRVSKYVKLMGLNGFENKYPAQLSGGMKQRAGIARALVMNPKVILMDEPFSALDYLTRRTLQDELLRLREQEKKTVFFVTHDINEAVYLADRVILLTPRPGTVQKEYVIERPFPRSRHDTYFMIKAAEIIADIGKGASSTSGAEYNI